MKYKAKNLPVLVYCKAFAKKLSERVQDLDFNDQMRNLVCDMWLTMYNAQGVGLAACQVGAFKRLAIMDLPVGKDKTRQVVMVNPEVMDSTGPQLTEREGCLSIPPVNICQGRVLRDKKVTVQYQDMEGREHTEEFIGYHARVVMHEIDHILGIFFIDRVGSLTRDIILQKFYREMLKNK